MLDDINSGGLCPLRCRWENRPFSCLFRPNVNCNEDSFQTVGVVGGRLRGQRREGGEERGGGGRGGKGGEGFGKFVEGVMVSVYLSASHGP